MANDKTTSTCTQVETAVKSTKSSKAFCPDDISALSDKEHKVHGYCLHDATQTLLSATNP